MCTSTELTRFEFLIKDFCSFQPKDKEVYTISSYDNGSYVSDAGSQGQGARYLSANKDPCVEEPQIGTFQPR